MRYVPAVYEGRAEALTVVVTEMVGLPVEVTVA
jgi:hypothetical protein